MKVEEVSELAHRFTGDGDAFEDFLKGEYDNISRAHFNTIQSISEFFKVYIGVVSLPISVAVIFLKPEELRQSGALRLLTSHSGLVLLGFGLFVLVSICVLGYIINLRCDAVLYARAINGIRNYFYEKSLISKVRTAIGYCRKGRRRLATLNFHISSSSSLRSRLSEPPIGSWVFFVSFHRSIICFHRSCGTFLPVRCSGRRSLRVRSCTSCSMDPSLAIANGAI